MINSSSYRGLAPATRLATPTIASPRASMPAFASPTAPSGAYALKPETKGKLMAQLSRAKDPLSSASRGDVVSSIASGKAPTADPAQIAEAQAKTEAKKRRQMAARLGVLRNQASVKPPVLSAPGTSTGAMPSTLPSATRAGMAVNRIL